ncbi:hypothetical protein ABZR34_31630, partial [Pseudomonas paraeruginosa]
HQGGSLSFELGGKRTSLLAHQTPLSRRGFSPKSVSGISRPLHWATNNLDSATAGASAIRIVVLLGITSFFLLS